MSYTPFSTRYEVTESDIAIADGLQSDLLAAITANRDDGTTSFDVSLPGATDGARVYLMAVTCQEMMPNSTVPYAVSFGSPDESDNPTLHYGGGGPLPDLATNSGNPTADQASADLFAPDVAAAIATLLGADPPAAINVILRKTVGGVVKTVTNGGLMCLLTGLCGTDATAKGTRGAGWRSGRFKVGTAPSIVIYR